VILPSGLHLLTALLAMLLFLGGCSEDPGALREERATLARQAYQQGADIHLAVVWHGGETSGFVAGAILAVEELNAAGGIDGRQLQLRVIDEAPFLAAAHVDRVDAEGRYRNAMQQAGTEMARAVLADPRVTGVIGHSDKGQTSLSAMTVYDAQGVLLLSAGTADVRLKWMASDLYFQMLPGHQAQMKKMAEEIRAQRWDRVHIVYANSRQYEQAAELIKSELAERGIALAGTTALVGEAVQARNQSRRLQASLDELRSGGVDAVVLLAPPAISAQVMRYARLVGIAQPFIGTMELDNPEFVRSVQEVGENTTVIGIYRDSAYQGRRFAQKFQMRFPELEADEWVALGYDSVQLYAQAVACAGTTDPYVVASSLHYKLPLWLGLVGRYAFPPGQAENVEMRFHPMILRRQTGGHLQFEFTDRPADDAALSE
jgi:branched-chain amino acid transport system substrate-binding protein